MKKNMSFLFLSVFLMVGLLASSARADLGLKQIMAGQGASAVGQTVLAAAKAAYAGGPSGTPDLAVVQIRLIDILNEAAATGDEQIIRYTLVAVMLAGGTENLATARAAINNSNVFANYETLTAVTVAATEELMKAGGGAGTGAGGAGTGANASGGADKELGGGDPRSYGGGAPQLYPWEIDPENPFTPKSGSGDNDIPATRI